jgi:DNA-directed RNA polymerase subunit F
MGVDANTAIKVVNLLPKKKEELMLIFEKTRFTPSEVQANEILELIKGLEK